MLNVFCAIFCQQLYSHWALYSSVKWELESGECGVQVLNNNDLSTSFYFVFALHHAMSSMGTLIILGEFSELSVWKVKTLHFQSHDKVDYHETVCVSRSLSSLWHPDCCHPEGCHHDQKPTEGAREGHSNGQEIAHQQKTAKISQDLNWRRGAMKANMDYCYFMLSLKAVMNSFSHYWSIEVT